MVRNQGACGVDHSAVRALGPLQKSGVVESIQGAMSSYSVVILICSIGLPHADCRPETALDVVRGPEVDNPVMCALSAQTMMARTDLVQGGAHT
jgi:hypothetical protein